MPVNHKDYDEEPVIYCSRCYSLNIKHEDVTDNDCCMTCGCTEVKETDIDTWESMYAKRYGHRFTQRGQNPRDSVYFKMTLSDLKTKVYNSNQLEKITKKLYPKFPKDLGKFDAVVFLFDKLIKDNRVDDLRCLLYTINR